MRAGGFGGDTPSNGKKGGRDAAPEVHPWPLKLLQNAFSIWFEIKWSKSDEKKHRTGGSRIIFWIYLITFMMPFPQTKNSLNMSDKDKIIDALHLRLRTRKIASTMACVWICEGRLRHWVSFRHQISAGRTVKRKHCRRGCCIQVGSGGLRNRIRSRKETPELSSCTLNLQRFTGQDRLHTPGNPAISCGLVKITACSQWHQPAYPRALQPRWTPDAFVAVDRFPIIVAVWIWRFAGQRPWDSHIGKYWSTGNGRCEHSIGNPINHVRILTWAWSSGGDGAWNRIRGKNYSNCAPSCPSHHWSNYRTDQDCGQSRRHTSFPKIIVESLFGCVYLPRFRIWLLIIFCSCAYALWFLLRFAFGKTGPYFAGTAEQFNLLIYIRFLKKTYFAVPSTVIRDNK